MEFLKKMRENREEKVKAMENVLNAAKTENRAMTAEEQASFDAIEKEIADIDKTIEAEERAAKAKNTKETGDNGATGNAGGAGRKSLCEVCSGRSGRLGGKSRRIESDNGKQRCNRSYIHCKQNHQKG